GLSCAAGAAQHLLGTGTDRQPARILLDPPVSNPGRLSRRSHHAGRRGSQELAGGQGRQCIIATGSGAGRGNRRKTDARGARRSEAPFPLAAAGFAGWFGPRLLTSSLADLSPTRERGFPCSRVGLVFIPSYVEFLECFIKSTATREKTLFTYNCCS